MDRPTQMIQLHEFEDFINNIVSKTSNYNFNNFLHVMVKFISFLITIRGQNA